MMKEFSNDDHKLPTGDRQVAKEWLSAKTDGGSPSHVVPGRMMLMHKRLVALSMRTASHHHMVGHNPTAIAIFEVVLVIAQKPDAGGYQCDGDAQVH
jgi:hypothetical protein